MAALSLAAALTGAFALGATLGLGLLTKAFAFAGLLGAALAFAVFATGFATGLATFALVGLAFLDDFTSCLLAGLPRTLSFAFAALVAAFAGFAEGADTARECTGFAMPNPISCKSETIIGLPG